MKAKLLLYPILESACGSLAHLFETLRQRFAICTCCGQNRYTGKPCVK
jgi:hypothetical protein